MPRHRGQRPRWSRAAGHHQCRCDQRDADQEPRLCDHDLKALAIPAWAPDTLVVNAKHPARTRSEFIAAAKGKSISFGSPGVGTTGHIVATNLFKQLTTIESVHVPFQGGAPLVNALLGGHIDVAAGAVVGFASQLQSGAIRAIVVATKDRLAQFADVPTYAESGFPGPVVENWVGVLRPARRRSRSRSSSTRPSMP